MKRADLVVGESYAEGHAGMNHPWRPVTYLGPQPGSAVKVRVRYGEGHYQEGEEGLVALGNLLCLWSEAAVRRAEFEVRWALSVDRRVTADEVEAATRLIKESGVGSVGVHGWVGFEEELQASWESAGLPGLVRDVDSLSYVQDGLLHLPRVVVVQWAQAFAVMNLQVVARLIVDSRRAHENSERAAKEWAENFPSLHLRLSSQKFEWSNSDKLLLEWSGASEDFAVAAIDRALPDVRKDEQIEALSAEVARLRGLLETAWLAFHESEGLKDRIRDALNPVDGNEA